MKSKKTTFEIEHYEDEESWLEARKGRITGTRAGKMVSKKDGKPNAEYYKTIAERVAIPRDGENVMERGKRLEIYGIERFEQETGEKVDKSLAIICRADDKDIAYSPDGFIGKTASIEVKCLNSASHIEALLTGKIPSEYEAQSIQPFVVNDSLKTLYFVFYDPSMPKDFFYFTINRKDKETEIAAQLEMERRILADIRAIESKLTF